MAVRDTVSINKVRMRILLSMKTIVVYNDIKCFNVALSLKFYNVAWDGLSVIIGLSVLSCDNWCKCKIMFWCFGNENFG